MKQPYTHRPLVGITIAFILGILLQRYCSFPFTVMAFAAFLLLPAAVIFRRKTWIATVCLLLSFCLLGGIYTHNRQTRPPEHLDHIVRYYPRSPVQLEGTVVSDIRHGNIGRAEKISFTLQVRRFETRWGWRAKTGKILIQLFRPLDVAYGDSLRLEGRLHRPFEFSKDKNFSYREYLENQGITSILSVGKKARVEILDHDRGNPLKAASLRVSRHLKDQFARYLTPNEAAIMQAMVLGDRTQLSEHIRKIFVETGTAHILAISGLHIGIVAFLIFVVIKLLPLPWRWHYILTIILLMSYAFLTGGRPSVVRATIMAVVFLAGFLTERETDSINSLALAALAILLVNPLNVFDLGFQLSFVSVLSILMLCPLVEKALPGNWQGSKFRRFWLRSLIVSCVAWIGVSGLIAYYFQIITPVTIAANLLVVPLMSAVVALGMGLLLAACFLPLCAPLVAVCLKCALNIMVGTAYLFGCLPGAYFYLKNVSFHQSVVYYMGVVVVLWGWRRAELTKKNNYDTVDDMTKRIIIIITFTALLLSMAPKPVLAFWVWTPETNKWVNPKYAVKETPEKQLAYAKEFFDSKEYDEAASEFRKLIKHYPRAREAAEAQFYLGRILEEQGRLFDAYKAYQMVIDKYPFSDRFPEIIAKEFAVGNRLLEGEQDKSGFLGGVLGSSYDPVEVFQTIIKNSPYGEYAAPSQYKIALYLQEKRLYQEARDEFEKVINDYPDSEWAKAAQYQLAITDAKRSRGAAYDQKVTQIAIEQFKEFVKDNPDAELSDNAQAKINELREKEAENNFITAAYYERRKQYQAARIYYDGIVQEFPDTQWAQKAQERLREIAAKENSS
jgi:outer membrane assembly lipoprotein YfiO